MNYSKTTMPVIFIGHGSPMNAIEKNEFTQSLVSLAKSIPQPRGIVSISLILDKTQD